MSGIKNSLLRVSTEPWPRLSCSNSLLMQREEGLISANHPPRASVSPVDRRNNPAQALYAALWEVKVRWLCAGGLSVITPTFLFM